MQEFAHKQQKAKLLLQSVSTPKASEYEIVHLDNSYFFKNFEKFRQELISEGWFTEDQIQIKYKFPTQKYLYAERILNRGYSFIPLHFMCDEAAKYLAENLFGEKILSDYALEDNFLEKIKIYLKEHIIDKKGKWVLKNPLISHNHTSSANLDEVTAPYQEINPDIQDEPIRTVELEEVVVSASQPDYMLRKLRNQYLHWSAKLNTFTDKFANSPTKNRKRMDF